MSSIALKMKDEQELSTSTVAFISNEGEIRGPSRWSSVKRGNGVKGGRERWILADVYAGKLSRL